MQRLASIRPALAPIACMALLAVAGAAQSLPPIPLTSIVPVPPDPIAELEVELPAADPFILKANVPVPRETFLPGGPLTLKIVDSDNMVWLDTQIEVVSRYADPIFMPMDGADVVELIARVKRDPSWATGSRRRYRVISYTAGSQPNPGMPDIQDLYSGMDGPRDVPASIQGLLADPFSIAVVAEDPLGNRYVAYPLEDPITDPGAGMRLYRYGPYMGTLRTYKVMEFESSPVPAGHYPHLLGVHAFLSTLSEEEVLMLDLRFHNGHSDWNSSTPTGLDDKLGKIYFNKIDLYVRAGQSWWTRQQFEDPFSFRSATDTPGMATLGGISYSVFPLVKLLPLSNGEQPSHVITCKGQFVRRLVISKDTTAAIAHAGELLGRAGQAFVVDGTSPAGRYWSWFNPATARYFPQRVVLPTLDYTNSAGYSGLSTMRSWLTSWFGDYRDRLANNTAFPLAHPETSGSSSQLGWARPVGAVSAGAEGGAAVVFLEGERAAGAASLDGYRLVQIVHRMQTERMPDVVYETDGEPTWQNKWLIPCPGSPCEVGGQCSRFTMTWGDQSEPIFCGTTGGPIGPWNQNAYVEASPDRIPGYEAQLHNWKPHDLQHFARYTRLPKALVWLGNDPVAREDVVAQAEVYRMIYSEYIKSDCSSVPGISLASDRNAVAARPNWGFSINRDMWGLDMANAAYAIQPDDWRWRMKPWYDRIVHMMDDGITHSRDPNFLLPGPGTVPYDWGVLYAIKKIEFYGTGATDPRARQTWHEVIIHNAIRGALESVYPSSDPLRSSLQDVLRRSTLGTIAPVSWSESANTMFGVVPVTPGTYPSIPYDCDGFNFTCPPGTNPLCCLPIGPGASNHYLWSTMVYGYELDSMDLIFLQRVAEQLTGSSCSTIAACRTAIRNSLQSLDPNNLTGALHHTWSNQATLLGFSQN